MLGASLGVGLLCLYGWFTCIPVTTTSVWHDRDEPEPSEGGRDYILYEERQEGLDVVRTEKGMFRLKIDPNNPNEAELNLLYLPTWSGSMTSPDANDINTAKILVDKLTQVAKQNQVDIVRVGIAQGQSEMYEKCGFQRDKGYLRFKVVCLTRSQTFYVPNW